VIPAPGDREKRDRPERQDSFDDPNECHEKHSSYEATELSCTHCERIRCDRAKPPAEFKGDNQSWYIIVNFAVCHQGARTEGKTI
jgi:hypothetical protein